MVLSAPEFRYHGHVDQSKSAKEPQVSYNTQKDDYNNKNNDSIIIIILTCHCCHCSHLA